MVTQILNLTSTSEFHRLRYDPTASGFTNGTIQALLQAPNSDALEMLRQTFVALPGLKAGECDTAWRNDRGIDITVGTAACQSDLESFANHASAVRSSFLFFAANWSVMLPKVAIQRLSGLGSFHDDPETAATAVKWVLAGCIVITPHAARYIHRNPPRGTV